MVSAGVMADLSAALIPSPAEGAATGVELGGTREVHRAFHPAVPIPGGPDTQVREPITEAEAFRAGITLGVAEIIGLHPGTVVEVAITTAAVPTTVAADTATAEVFTSATTVIRVTTAATTRRTIAIRT